jgi:choline kinase
LRQEGSHGTHGAISPFAGGFRETLGFPRPGRGLIKTAGGQARGYPRRRRVTGRTAQALILAAGRGSRLGQGPKCLCAIGGRPLVEHQLEALEDTGIDSTAIVVGFEQERVRDVVGDRATYIVNEQYAATNSLYSFLLARDWVERDVLVFNSDVLFHPQLLYRLQGWGGNALLFDSGSCLEAEEMKVAHRGHWLEKMSKELPPDRSQGENVGLLRLGRSAARHAFSAAESTVANGGRRDWLASAINQVARAHRFRCLDVAGMPWTEIDFPSDLERARVQVWPAIAASRWAERLATQGLPAGRGNGRGPSIATT